MWITNTKTFCHKKFKFVQNFVFLFNGEPLKKLPLFLAIRFLFCFSKLLQKAVSTICSVFTQKCTDVVKTLFYTLKELTIRVSGYWSPKCIFFTFTFSYFSSTLIWNARLFLKVAFSGYQSGKKRLKKFISSNLKFSIM